MTCFETINLHPEDRAGERELSAALAHAGECEACAARVAEAQAIDGLLREGLSTFCLASACPEPDVFAEWVDAGRPEDAELDEHLSGCAECREDLLAILEDLQEAPVELRLLPREATPSRSQRAIAWAAAAALAGAMGLTTLYGFGEQGPTAARVPTSPLQTVTSPAPIEVEVTRQPLPPVERAPSVGEGELPPIVVPQRPSPAPAPGQSPTEPKPAPQPTNAPAPQPTNAPAPQPTAEPAPQPTSEPQPSEQPSETPSKSPAPSASPTTSPEPTSSPEPAAPVSVAALEVHAVSGLYAQGANGKTWTALSEGASLPVGAQLRAGNEGARFRTAGGAVFLQGGAKLSYEARGEQGSLRLHGGQAVLEGKALSVAGSKRHDWQLEVKGRVFLEARGDAVGVRVLVGSATFRRGGQEHALDAGKVLTAKNKRAPRTAQDTANAGLPAWVAPLRPRPPRGPGRRGGKPPRRSRFR